MTIKERFDDYFKSRKISQKEIAIKTGYSQTLVGRYLRKPNFDFITILTNEYPDIDWNFILKEERTQDNINSKNLLDAIDSLTKQLRNK
jgi:transcriptional regulator with XRE-family HTH domain